MTGDEDEFPTYLNILADKIADERDASRGHDNAAILVLQSLCIQTLTEANHAPYNLSIEEATIAQCFVCTCVWGVHNSLKNCKVETDFIELCLRAGRVVFFIFPEKENQIIVTEGFQVFQGLAQNLEKKNLLSWFNSVNKGIYTYVMCGDDKMKETIIKDVLRPSYSELLKAKN
tara:strand:- start:199 stop:720 length:522 start_codon:yes stop_codon:yes gene_type:complete